HPGPLQLCEQELAGDLGHDPSAIPRLRVGGDRAPVRQVDDRGERFLHDVMAGLASDVRDEADAAGIVLEAWVVEGADCAGWEVASHPDTFFPAFEMRSSLPGETKTPTAWPHLAQAVDVVVLRCPASSETTRIVRSPAATDKSARSLVPILCRHGGDRAGARSPHARSPPTGGAIGIGASSVLSRLRGERGVVSARAGRRADVVAVRRRVA